MSKFLNYSNQKIAPWSPYIIFILFFICSFFLLYPPIYNKLIKICKSQLFCALLISGIIASIAFLISSYNYWKNNNNYEIIID